MSKGEASLAKLGRLTRIAIMVYILAAIANLAVTVLSFAWLGSLLRAAPGDHQMIGIMVIGVISSVISLISLISIPASVILVALWVNCAWSNLHEARLEGLNYTPGWATASFFIPFVNMVVPMRALRELHNRSHGESDWHAAISVGDVTSWYACLWAAFLVGIALTVFLALDSIPNLYVILPTPGWILLGILLAAFLLGSAWFLYRIIGKVTAAQSAMLHYAQAETFT